MKKGILIIGDPATGKSIKQREIAANYAKEHTLQIFADSIYYIKQDTQLVVIEGVPHLGCINYWKYNIEYGIYKENTIIRPQIMLVSNSITKDQLAKLTFDVAEFFEVIECIYDPNYKRPATSLQSSN